MAEIKISELEPTTDLEGLYTIGSDKNNLSKKVSLQFLREAADYAIEQGDYAKQEGSTIESRIADFKAETDVKLTELESEVPRIGVPLFSEKPMLEEFTLEKKQLNSDGSLRDYNFDNIRVYKIQGGMPYRIYGGTIGSNIYLYAFYSSATPSAESLVKMGYHITGEATARVYDFIEIAPKNATHLVVCYYVNPISGIANKAMGYSAIESSLIKNGLDYLEKIVIPPQFAVEVISNEEISITRRYSENEDVRVTLKKCGVNNLVQISEHSFIANNDMIPTLGNAVIIKTSGTDWIGPYVIKANNRSGSYNGLTGGWHGYNGDQTGAKTAETSEVRILIDNKTSSIGTHYCNEVKVIVTNLIQAGNTKSADGNGINVLREVVTYHFKDSKIYVSVVMTALEDISFKKYYGMQVAQYGQSIRYFANNVTYKVWDAEVNRTSNKELRFIMCSDENRRYVKASVDFVGLGMREYSNIYSYAFVAGDKAYFSLVDADYKELTLVQGEQAYWRGYYEFLSNKDAADVF